MLYTNSYFIVTPTDQLQVIHGHPTPTTLLEDEPTLVPSLAAIEV
jgi:hypothetical protein